MGFRIIRVVLVGARRNVCMYGLDVVYGNTDVCKCMAMAIILMSYALFIYLKLLVQLKQQTKTMFINLVT